MEKGLGEEGCLAAAALALEKFQDGSGGCPASRFTSIDADCLQQPKRIGSGGFGDVYKARHRSWSTWVAIKSMRMNRNDARELLEEAEKMHKAQFEHVLRLYGFTKWSLGNGTPSLGLVTEFMENGSLDKLLEHYAVPWPLRLRFAYEIALGVNYLHNLKPALFHHDLKPANILLNKDYRVKICDFGLAKWRRSTGQHSINSEIEGTLYYMPPECFKDINTRKAVKYDVYSYGIVIWEILTCQTPYKNAVNSQHLKLCVENGGRPDIKDIPIERPESSEVLVDLMEKCWRENPDERPTFLKCVYDLELKQSNEQELQFAIRTLTQQVPHLVDRYIDRSTPGSSEATCDLCEPVQEQNEATNLLEPVEEQNEHKHFVEPVEEQNEHKHFVEPVEEQNEHKHFAVYSTEHGQEINSENCIAESVQNTSQEEIVKYPLSIVTSDECMTLAKLINKDWKMLGRSLGLTNGDINCIDHDNDWAGLDEQAYQMLQKWMQQQGKSANRRLLVFHLKKIKRNDLAMLFCC
ncbi:receptor-interacting serine/threonine-protein kinase 2-like [Mustelus asterias]